MNEDTILYIIFGVIIILFLIYLGIIIWTLTDAIKNNVEKKWKVMLIVSLVFSLTAVGMIFGVIVTIIYWSSKKKIIEDKKVKDLQNEELRQAQLSALKKGDSQVEIKGKMKKIK